MQTVTTFTPATDRRNIESYRRERSFYKAISLIDLDKGQEVASVRFYGPNSTVYCVTWLFVDGYRALTSARGYGKASGGGYHKESAAMSEALQAAGVRLAEPIEGRGDGAMRESLQALAAHLGIARPYINHAHA
ncbi:MULTISPECIES: hypothetical protein [unclassified Agrobacterium]